MPHDLCLISFFSKYIATVILFPEINYGILDIEPEKNKITVSIHNRDGLVLNSQIIKLPLEKTEA